MKNSKLKNSKFKYFTQLELENVRAFGTKQILKLADENGDPTQWTVLLGDNGVGKSTLLECFGWMMPNLADDEFEYIKLLGIDEGDAYIIEKVETPNKDKSYVLVPTLQNEYNNDFLKFLVKHKKNELRLIAGISNGKKLAKPVLEESKRVKSKNDISNIIVTGVRISYERGRLNNFAPQGNNEINTDHIRDYKLPTLIVYGANRYLGSRILPEIEESTTNRLKRKTKLADAEVILQQLDYAALKNNTKEDKNRLENSLRIAIKILRLSSKDDIKINPPATVENTPIEQVGVWINWFSGWVPLTEVSLGYKIVLSLALDLAWQLFQKDTRNSNALNEPAIVIIDELDLHLHPRWQLEIMDDLSELFPSIQFIATAHSPLIVQSSPTANFAVVHKRGNEAVIVNDPHVVTDWRVDQILNSELFERISPLNNKIESLIQEKYKILSAPVRDDNRLNEINKEILELTMSDQSEDRKALNFIDKAAQILKKHGVSLDD
jgi:predicted ATP-binding protein involved in virulence